MPLDTTHHNVGLLYATNLHDDQQLFQLDKVYTVKCIYNSELEMDVYALMDGDTYSGCLTAAGIKAARGLFQPGFTVKIRVNKMNATQPPRWSNQLKRMQAWTTGRGDLWHEADEGEKADNDKGIKGSDQKAESKSAPAEDSSSGQSSTE